MLWLSQTALRRVGKKIFGAFSKISNGRVYYAHLCVDHYAGNGVHYYAQMPAGDFLVGTTANGSSVPNAMGTKSPFHPIWMTG